MSHNEPIDCVIIVLSKKVKFLLYMRQLYTEKPPE
nr:MAG TPA: hypothetical protein [Caudoviricetes sp.]